MPPDTKEASADVLFNLIITPVLRVMAPYAFEPIPVVVALVTVFAGESIGPYVNELEISDSIVVALG